MTELRLPHACENMRTAVYDGRYPVEYYPRFREYGVLLAGGSAFQLIEYCPWCGARLPQSLRDRFFELLEQIGENPESKNLPIDFQTDAWWRIRDVD